MLSDLCGGLDEVGFGAWAGPIISVVAVFPYGTQFPAGVTDSKKTSEIQRRALYLPLCKLATDVGVGHAWPWEIDSLGVVPSLQMSYRRALDDLKTKPTVLIVDGSFPVRSWGGKQIVAPKADLDYQEVSAASMIAKHLRDTMMVDYAKQFPGYNWEKNCGYGTHDHAEGIKKLGFLIDRKDHSRYLHREIYCRKLRIRMS